MGIKNIILVKTGSSHSLERLPWTSVPINHRDITWGTGLTNALQCVSLKCGASLDITHSGGWLSHSWWTRGGYRKVHGAVFYADAGIIVSRDQECLQGDINVIIVLFRKFGLMVNVAKSENMNCQEGVIWTGMTEEDWMGRSRIFTGIYYQSVRQNILHLCMS